MEDLVGEHRLHLLEMSLFRVPLDHEMMDQSELYDLALILQQIFLQHVFQLRLSQATNIFSQIYQRMASVTLVDDLLLEAN